MSREDEHHEERTHDNSGLENRNKQQPEHIRGLLVLLATAVCVLGYMLSLDPSHRATAVVVFFTAWVILGLAIAVPLWLEYRKPTNTVHNKLDNDGSSSLTESKSPSVSPTVSRFTASPSTSPLPTETPKATDSPIASPTHRVASLSLGDVWQKLSEAISSPGSRKYDEVRNALKGVPVDWTLNFLSANRDSTGKLMQVWLYDPKQSMGVVVADLPLTGNERLPLMEQTDVFRVRGIIDEPIRVTVINLRAATLEYVRSDSKK